MLRPHRLAFVGSRGKEMRIALIRRDVIPADRRGSAGRVEESGGVRKTVGEPTDAGATPTRNAPALDRVDIGLGTRQEIVVEACVVILDDAGPASVVVANVFPAESRCRRARDFARAQ